jgi:acetyltransferase-like isoleucine patch superfamily enzyme
MASGQLESNIQGEIDAREITLGKGVVVEPGAVITGKGGPADEVVLGDFAFVGRGTRIMVPRFSLGDYSKLHSNSFAHGAKPLQIGRNCWIGGNVVLDSMGGLDIDDNVGIGAQSQLWTHIRFGDIVEGCRFFSDRYMHVGKDAWFVGHCIVSPVDVGERSMAMVGSVVTKDMLPNRVYAGIPAADITEKVGPQFEDRSVQQKAEALSDLIDSFVAEEPEFAGQLVVVESSEDRPSGLTWFDVSTRTYNKRYAPAETAFLRAMTPLIKFVPEGESPFVTPRQSTG